MREGPAQPDASILVSLTHDESLVLFEFLARGDETRPDYRVEHSAEQVALWRLQGQIDKQLDELLRPDYGELLDAAQARLAIDLVE